MKAVGYIKLHRKLFDSEVFADPKLLKTWIWCLMSANWDGRKLWTGDTLERGEFITGYRKASHELGFSKNTIMRHFKKLVFLEMIETHPGTKGTRVVINNYHSYQSFDDENAGTVYGTLDTSTLNGKTGAKAGAGSKKRDGLRYTNGDADGDSNGDANGDYNNKITSKQNKKKYTHIFESFWNVYPRRVAKANAFVAFKNAVKRCDAKDIIDAAEVFGKSPKGRGKFCPHPATWLNGDRWLDDPKEWNEGDAGVVYKPRKKSPEQSRLEAAETKVTSMRTALQLMPEGDKKTEAIAEWKRCKEILFKMQEEYKCRTS